MKNQWRKDNISSIEAVKKLFIDYVGPPPKHSVEAKLLKLNRESKK